MKYVLRAVNVLAAVIIALALLVLLRTVFTPAGEVPTLGGYSFMRTLTGSMEPAIPVHSFLITDDVDPESLQVGDIITFRSTEPNLEGALNTHRITSVYEENGQLMFRTKGDANAVEDSEPVAAVNVVGKVVFVLFFIPKFAYNAVILCEPIIWCFMAAYLVLVYLHDPFVFPKKAE